jgi:hypothetical protein
MSYFNRRVILRERPDAKPRPEEFLFRHLFFSSQHMLVPLNAYSLLSRPTGSPYFRNITLFSVLFPSFSYCQLQLQCPTITHQHFHRCNLGIALQLSTFSYEFPSSDQRENLSSAVAVARLDTSILQPCNCHLTGVSSHPLNNDKYILDWTCPFYTLELLALQISLRKGQLFFIPLRALCPRVLSLLLTYHLGSLLLSLQGYLDDCFSWSVISPTKPLSCHSTSPPA